MFLKLTFHTRSDCFEIEMEEDVGDWFLEILDDLSPAGKKAFSIADMKASYESQFGDFQIFWNSDAVCILRDNGLLVL